MNPRNRTIITTVGSLITLGIIGSAIGFTSAILTSRESASLQFPEPMPEVTSMSTGPLPKVPPPTVTGRAPPTALIRVPRATSTPQITVTIMAKVQLNTEIVVRYGESVYPVCRRNCPGIWPLNDVPP